MFEGVSLASGLKGFPLTFPRYTQFGTKLSSIFGFAKSRKYKTNFPLSQLPKLLVACVSGWHPFNMLLF
jgi:hypothetical protein